MNYAWAKDLHDRDGDVYDDCLLVFIGEETIIKFQDSVELEQFANRILQSLPEIRATG